MHSGDGGDTEASDLQPPARLSLMLGAGGRADPDSGLPTHHCTLLFLSLAVWETETIGKKNHVEDRPPSMGPSVRATGALLRERLGSGCWGLVEGE